VVKNHIKGILSWIIPREKTFFRLLDGQAAKNVEASELLVQLLYDRSSANRKQLAAVVSDIEHHGDKLRREFIHELDKTLITPMDQSDLYTLSASIEGVLDDIEEAAFRAANYEVEQMALLRGQAEILRDCCREVVNAVKGLENDRAKATASAAAIERKEHDGDVLYRKLLVEVLQNPYFDTLEKIKLKEIADLLEDSIDHCDRFADEVENMLIKYA